MLPEGQPSWEAALTNGRISITAEQAQQGVEYSLGLAPKASDYLYRKISETNRNGRSMIIVEQNVRKALSVAHRAYVVSLGRKRFEGKPEVLSSNDQLKELVWGSMN